MTGNAMEEGLFRQLDNPSHTDPARLGFLAGGAAGFLAALGLAQLVTLEVPGFVALWVLAGLPVAVLVTRRITRRRLAARAAAEQARRAAHEAETRRRIAAMKRAARAAGAERTSNTN